MSSDTFIDTFGLLLTTGSVAANGRTAVGDLEHAPIYEEPLTADWLHELRAKSGPLRWDVFRRGGGLAGNESHDLVGVANAPAGSWAVELKIWAAGSPLRAWPTFVADWAKLDRTHMTYGHAAFALLTYGYVNDPEAARLDAALAELDALFRRDRRRATVRHEFARGELTWRDTRCVSDFSLWQLR
jgi:hypothetical protein